MLWWHMILVVTFVPPLAMMIFMSSSSAGNPHIKDLHIMWQSVRTVTEDDNKTWLTQLFPSHIWFPQSAPQRRCYIHRHCSSPDDDNLLKTWTMSPETILVSACFDKLKHFVPVSWMTLAPDMQGVCPEALMNRVFVQVLLSYPLFVTSVMSVASLISCNRRLFGAA